MSSIDGTEFYNNHQKRTNQQSVLDHIDEDADS